MCCMCGKKQDTSIYRIDGKRRRLCVSCACLPIAQIQAFFTPKVKSVSRPKRRVTSKKRERSEEMNPDSEFSGRLWTLLKKRYNYTCLCCGGKEPDIELVADHVIPKSKGGPNIIANIQPLCRSCNARKGIRSFDYRSQKPVA